MAASFGFSARGEGSDTLELDIYDVVGAPWSDATAQRFRGILARSQASAIELRINSEGGSVFDGFAIYNMLNEHPARVVGHVDAIAASVASVILMSCDEVHVAANAFVMIHNPHIDLRGGSGELRKYADVLDKMRDNAADIYAARSGQTRERVLEMMDAETWMSATEAKALGFADHVTPLKQASAKAQARAFASMSLRDLSNVPEAVRQEIELARKQAINAAPSGLGDVETNNSPNPQGEFEMDEKTFFASMGVSNAAEFSARISVLAKLEAVTGGKAEEALGIVMAWKQSHDSLPELQAKLAAQAAVNDAQELDAAFAEARRDLKHTPAIETEMRRQLSAKETTLAGVKATLKALHPIKAFANVGGPAAPTVQATAKAEMRHNGKLFDEMSGGERAALKREDESLYVAMRDASKR